MCVLVTSVNIAWPLQFTVIRLWVQWELEQNVGGEIYNAHNRNIVFKCPDIEQKVIQNTRMIGNQLYCCQTGCYHEH